MDFIDIFIIIPGAIGVLLTALADPTYLHNKTMLYIFGTFQTATLISALKPWEKRKKLGHRLKKQNS